MLGVRRIRPGVAVLFIAILFAAGCTTARFDPPATPGASVAAPVKGAAAKFAFAPIEGVPVAILQAMSNALNQEAAAKRLNVVPYADPAAVYIVRGYISAVAEGQNAKLVYVWDVVDRQGTRLHRVTGQEIGGVFRNGDPWTGVGAANVANSARKTMDSLANWVK
ncbi:MAG TPA: hypothetical protein VFK86_16330 [Bauldia sp.]|nr:hypothetical protein [Bauldia sp.]